MGTAPVAAASPASGAIEATGESLKPKPAARGGNGSIRRVKAAATGRERSGIHSRGASGGAGGRAASAHRLNGDRRQRERRGREDSIPFPDRRLTRSAYEQVFLKLVSGERLRVGRETYTPVGMKGWYHAVFRRDSDGHERLLTIAQLLKKMKDWLA